MYTYSTILGAALLNTSERLADCTSFQEFCGAIDSTDALSYIFFNYIEDAAVDNYAVLGRNEDSIYITSTFPQGNRNKNFRPVVDILFRQKFDRDSDHPYDTMTILEEKVDEIMDEFFNQSEFENFSVQEYKIDDIGYSPKKELDKWCICIVRLEYVTGPYFLR